MGGKSFPAETAWGWVEYLNSISLAIGKRGILDGVSVFFLLVNIHFSPSIPIQMSLAFKSITSE
jgi:hypothetical protein